MLASLRTHYGPLPGSRVISNGREPSAFAPGVKEPLVLSVGRLWDEAKNVGALAEVASRLSWPVCVAGELAHPEGGEVALASVRPLGRLSPRELAAWYGRASIYALPARYEPFGLSALEAALAGCALVLGDIPSLREIWGDAALYAPPGDNARLAAVLQSLIDEDGLRSELAARARDRAMVFTTGEMADAYLAAYRGLIAASRAVPGRAAARCAGRGRVVVDVWRGGRVLRIVMFYHSLLSDWNHGNAHFLRGVTSELLARGHEVVVYEPRDSWSLANLLAEHGPEPIQRFRAAYPHLASRRYRLSTLDLERATDRADLVIVHEWNDHELVRRLGRIRREGGGSACSSTTRITGSSPTHRRCRRTTWPITTVCSHSAR